MKYYTLDQDEQEILDQIENNEWNPVKDKKTFDDDLQVATKSFLDKTKNINIRLTESDVVKLKSIAVSEGIPYQTLVGSVLHKFASRYYFESEIPSAASSFVSEATPKYQSKSSKQKDK